MNIWSKIKEEESEEKDSRPRRVEEEEEDKEDLKDKLQSNKPQLNKFHNSRPEHVLIKYYLPLNIFLPILSKKL